MGVLLVFAATLLLALFTCAFLSGCSSNQQQEQTEPEYMNELMDKNTLTVLTSLDYAPFDAGTTEEAWGFDIAVAQEIANRLNLNLNIVNVPRDTILRVLACEPLSPQIEGEELVVPDPQGDIALAAFAITSERDDLVDFSSWYFVGNQAVVTLKNAKTATSETNTKSTKAANSASSANNSKNSKDAKDAAVALNSTADFDREKTRIAVVKGSTCFETAQAFTDEKLIAEYSTAQKCLQAIQAKEVQAAVLDLPVARYLIKNGFSDMRILEQINTGEAYGIAIPTQSSHLKDAINKVLEEMEADGTLERLENEYLK